MEIITQYSDSTEPSHIYNITSIIIWNQTNNSIAIELFKNTTRLATINPKETNWIKIKEI